MPRKAPRDEGEERMGFLLDLRRRGIGDQAVLRAMDEVPREHFVDADHVEAAYADQALPIACGQTISQPYVVAYMTEQLALAPQHRVLEIGTGSGYQAAVLSRLAREVVTVERYRTLAETARMRLETLGYGNVTVVTEEIPDALVAQLGEGGVMVLPLGPHGGAQRIVKLTKSADVIARADLIWVRFVPLLPGQAREL